VELIGGGVRLGRWSESRSYAFVDQRVVEKVEMGQRAHMDDRLGRDGDGAASMAAGARPVETPLDGSPAWWRPRSEPGSGSDAHGAAATAIEGGDSMARRRPPSRKSANWRAWMCSCGSGMPIDLLHHCHTPGARSHHSRAAVGSPVDPGSMDSGRVEVSSGRTCLIGAPVIAEVGADA
jgi:hypothetical protein